MASDKTQYKRALQNWESLHKDRNYSYPTGVGRIAILCSYYSHIVKDYDEEGEATRRRKEIRRFRNEAFALGDLLENSGRSTEVVLNVQASDIDAVLIDPSISGVYTIGHGTLRSFLINDQDISTYEWNRVSEKADHLKTGTFVQRQCGMLAGDISVPLGTFAVTDHRNVIAPVSHAFDPRGLYHPENDLLRSVSDVPAMSYDYVKSNLSCPPPK